MRILTTSFKVGNFEKCNSPNITIVRTVALVSCLARLHNFCIDKVERGKDLNQSNKTLPADLEHMMNQLEGYVPMIGYDNHDVPIPYEIMNIGNQFEDCP